jgi:acyl-CoA synthetase (AMP-forming)/AMP-acid ligase II
MFCAIYGVQRDDVVFHSGMPLYHSAAGMLGAGSMVTTGVTLVLTRKFSASSFFKTCTYHFFLFTYNSYNNNTINSQAHNSV